MLPKELLKAYSAKNGKLLFALLLKVEPSLVALFSESNGQGSWIALDS